MIHYHLYTIISHLLQMKAIIIYDHLLIVNFLDFPLSSIIINNQHYLFSMCDHHQTSIIIYYHLLSSITIYYHLLSSIIIYYHLLSSIIIYYHPQMITHDYPLSSIHYDHSHSTWKFSTTSSTVKSPLWPPPPPTAPSRGATRPFVAERRHRRKHLAGCWPPKNGQFRSLTQRFYDWLVVLTILKNDGVRPWEGLSHIVCKKKHVWNHQPNDDALRKHWIF